MIQIQSDSKGIHVVTLDHGKANTLDTALCRELTGVLNELSDAAGAVVLTGNGRCFSAGVDLVAIGEGGADYVAEFLPELIRMFRAVFEFRRPLIAAINGHAIAGGCVIACAADLRIMSNSSARIGMAELAVGVPLPASAIEIVRFACAGDRLQEILYLARTIPTEEALTLGLVDTVEESVNLLNSAIEMAGSLSKIPPKAFDLTKQRLRAAVIRDLDSAINQDYDKEVLRAWQSDEVLAAIRKFVEKTLGR